MPLDIHLDADIDGLREFAGKFRKLAQHAHEIGTDVRGAGSNSTQDWGGESGPAFRAAMSDFGGSADKVHGGADKLASGVDNFTDQINHVRSRLRQARQVASQAGLPTTDKQISEPSSGPGAPKPLPKDATAHQKQAHTAASQAHAAHQAQQKAYHECTKTVADARKCEQQANSYLQSLVGSDTVHAGLKATTAITGLAGAATGASRALRSEAKSLYSKAAAESSIVDANLAKGGNPNALVDAIQRRSQALTTANARSRQATSTIYRRQLGKLPEWAQRSLGNVVEQDAKAASKLGKVGLPILKRVPILGTIGTGVGATIDIAHGGNPVKAIGGGILSLEASTVAGGAVSGGMGAASGALAGTTTGEMIGAAAGPVGIVAGAAVGAGVGWGVQHWDDVKWAAGKATDWVGDRFSDVGHAIGSIF